MTKRILSFCLSVILLVSMMSVCGLVLPVMAAEQDPETATTITMTHKNEIIMAGVPYNYTYVATGLTPGRTYRVRAYSATLGSWLTPTGSDAVADADGTVTFQIKDLTLAAADDWSFPLAPVDNMNDSVRIQGGGWLHTGLKARSGMYVNPNSGSDDNDGLTKETAKKTAVAAINAINAGGYTGARAINFDGTDWTYRIDPNFANGTTNWVQPITLRSTNSGTTIWLSSSDVLTKGPLHIEHTVIGTTHNVNMNIRTGLHAITFADDARTNSGVINRFQHGYNASTSTDAATLGNGQTAFVDLSGQDMNFKLSDLNLPAGTTISTLSFAVNGSSTGAVQMGAANIVLDDPGVNITTFRLGGVYPDYYGSTGGFANYRNNHFTSFNLTVNSVASLGALSEPNYQGAYHVTGPAQYLFNNGLGDGFALTGLNTNATDKPGYATGGHWIVRSEKKDGCYLEMTETAGVYTVYGGKIATAVSADGSKTYISGNGVLTIPTKGDYTVTYGDPTGIYVDCTNGSDSTNDGFSPSSALKSFAAAVNKINSLGLTGDARQIIVVKCGWAEGNLNLSSCTPWTENITISCENPGTTIWMSNSSIMLNGPMTLNAIVGDSAGQNHVYIYTRGYDLVLGDRYINSKYTDKGAETVIYAGVDYAAQAAGLELSDGRYQLGRDNNVTVKGTKTQTATIYFGNKAAFQGTYYPVKYNDGNLVIDNPNLTITTLHFGITTNQASNNTADGGRYEALSRYDNLKIRIDNVAAINTLSCGAYQGGVGASSVQAIFNNGTYDKIVNAPTFNWATGDWTKNGFVTSNAYVLKSDATDGCSLNFTGTVGAFTVVGGKFANATSGTVTYYSSEGALIVPKGEYAVTYTDEGHTHDYVWTYDDTQHWKGCSCGLLEGEKANHNFSDWEITKDPSTTEEGSKRRSCECGKVETQTIPMVEGPTTAIYVDGTNGSDENSGTTSAKALKTIAAAVVKIEELGLTGDTRKIIVVNAEATYSLDLHSVATYTEMITLVTADPEATIKMSAGTVALAGPMTINAKIGNETNKNASYIFTRGFELVLGELFEDVYYDTYWNGSANVTGGGSTTIAIGYTPNYDPLDPGENKVIQFGKDISLTVLGNKSYAVSIFVGNSNTVGNPVQYGDAYVYLNNPNLTVKTFDFGNRGSYSNTSSDWSKHTRFDDLKVVIDQVAVIEKWQVNSYNNAVSTNTLQVLFNNDTYAKTTFDSNFSWHTGYPNAGFNSNKRYIMKSAATDGSKLQLTDTVGTFNVVGDKRAIVSGVASAASSQGVLKLTTVGEYNVAYTTATLNGWYVDTANGDDANDGLTPDTAFKSLKKATAAANASDVKMVVIVGECSGLAGSSFGSYTTPITIRGYDENSVIGFRYRIEIPGPTTFENITINGGGQYFWTRGYDVTFGEGLTVNSLYVIVGEENANVTTAPKLTLLSGHYNEVLVGTYYNKQRTEMAGAEVYIGKDATVGHLEIGTKKGGATQIYPTDFTGNVKLTINGTITGGAVTDFRLTSGSQASRFNAGFQLIYNNNKAASNVLVDAMKADTYAEAVVTTATGTWILKADTGIYLTATETLGTYTVEGGKTVVATDASGKKYRSDNGKLVVPAGVYTVVEHTAGNAPFYSVYDDRVEVYESVNINLDTLAYLKTPGKAFVGWTDEEGNFLSGYVACTAGDVLIPQYVNFDNSVGGDFSIIGAQMRTSGVQGLRFIVQQSKSFTAELKAQLKAMYAAAGENFVLEQTAFGAIAIPSVVLNANEWTELTKDGVYSYNGKNYTPAGITAEKIYNYGADSLQYTIVITNINSATHYNRQYTVRGYVEYTMKYTDGTEQTVVVYTDYYSTNLVAVAEATIATPAVNPVDIPVLRDVITTAKEYTENKFESGTTTPVTPNDGAPLPGSDFSFYTQDASGLTVRDIVIDFSSGSEKHATTIMQLSDTHFYYMNDADWMNATLVGTEAGRTWTGIKNQSNIPTVRRAVEYAGIADQIVITGDVIDVLQLGALDVVQKEIIEKYPQVLLVNGNHDYIQSCETYVGDVYDLATRYDILNNAWASTYNYTSNGLGGKGDVSYASKLVDNTVMTIQLDNGQGQFTEGTAEKLAADLQLARNNGYIVLLFMHEPICTGNEAESSVMYYQKNDNSTVAENFYTGQVGGTTANEYTTAVMNVIKDNADVIKGVYNGHMHADFYTEIVGTGAAAGNVIPQYTMSGTTYGQVTKITVYTDEPTMEVEDTNLFYGEILEATFTNVQGVVEFGLLKCDENGNLTKESYLTGNISGYRKLPLGTTGLTLDTDAIDVPATPGKYLACIWSTGWNFYAQIPVTIIEGSRPTLSLSNTEFVAGTGNITLTASTTATEDLPLEMGLFLLNDGGEYDISTDDATLRPRYRALEVGTDSTTFVVPSVPGTYKAVLWTTGRDILSEVTFTIVKAAEPSFSVSATDLTIGENITLDAGTPAIVVSADGYSNAGLLLTMGIYKTDEEGNYDIRDASQRVRYYALKNGEQIHTFTAPDEAGTYKAVLWTTGYTVLDEIDLVVTVPAPAYSMSIPEELIVSGSGTEEDPYILRAGTTSFTPVVTAAGGSYTYLYYSENLPAVGYGAQGTGFGDWQNAGGVVPSGSNRGGITSLTHRTSGCYVLALDNGGDMYQTVGTFDALVYFNIERSCSMSIPENVIMSGSGTKEDPYKILSTNSIIPQTEVTARENYIYVYPAATFDNVGYEGYTKYITPGGTISGLSGGSYVLALDHGYHVSYSGGSFDVVIYFDVISCDMSIPAEIIESGSGTEADPYIIKALNSKFIPNVFTTSSRTSYIYLYEAANFDNVGYAGYADYNTPGGTIPSGAGGRGYIAAAKFLPAGSYVLALDHGSFVTDTTGSFNVVIYFNVEGSVPTISANATEFTAGTGNIELTASAAAAEDMPLEFGLFLLDGSGETIETTASGALAVGETTITFSVPAVPGTYKAVMWTTDDKVLDEITITVNEAVSDGDNDEDVTNPPWDIDPEF